MPILLIDNYDSFTYNVVHLLRDCGADEVAVLRNDELDVADIARYDAVVASPGPGLPDESGELLAAVRFCLEHDVPYLGICLGHQALGEAVGARLAQLDEVRHGVQHTCAVAEPHDLLEGVPMEFEVGLYHSWVVSDEDLPDAFAPLAYTAYGTIQAAHVPGKRAYGVQFHPESIMSPDVGPRIMRNFLDLARPLAPAARA